MEAFGSYVILTILGPVIGIGLYIVIRGSKKWIAYKHFQKTMKPGDKCCVYLGNGKYIGEIKSINRSTEEVIVSFSNSTNNPGIGFDIFHLTNLYPAKN